MADIGERIKTIRGSLSREKFSARTGISKTALVNYETGSRTPSADYLGKILNEFSDISPSWLLANEGEMKRRDTGITPPLSLKDIENLMTVEDDKLRLERIGQAIDEKLLKYGLDLIRDKRLILMMTLYSFFGKKFCENQEAYFERAVDGLVRLCLPDERFATMNEVNLHIAFAREGLQEGDIDRGRREYLEAAMLLVQVVEIEGGKWTKEQEIANKECTSFANADPVYQDGLALLLPIIESTPGILQADLHKRCPEIKRETISYIICFASLLGVIKRTKKRRTYQLNLA
jgi:transcriptional regulator with XRE-family HTH domain